MLTLGLVTLAPLTTVKASEAIAGVSVVVDTDRVLLPAVAFVMPRSVISSWSLALTKASVLKKQVTARLPSGLLQKPTFCARVTSRTVAPFQPWPPLPAGSWMVMRLLAALERPPLAETL